MRKDPTLACLLSLLLVGAGHMYLGQLVKGLVILAIGVVLGFFTFGVGLIPLVAWAMFDSYRAAKRMNPPARKPVPTEKNN